MLFFLGPAFTTVLTSILFNDPFTVFDGFCSVFCVLGVLLIVRPRYLFGGNIINGTFALKDSTEEEALAVISALSGAVLSAGAYVAARKSGKNTHNMVHIFYVGFLAAVLSYGGLFALQNAKLPEDISVNEWIQLAYIGVFAFLGQYLLNEG